ETARCLTLLDRDLAHAEALLREAAELSKRVAVEPPAIPDALGMLNQHAGRLAEARESFTRARDLCRKEQDHLGEFRALEHLFWLEVQSQHFDEARRLCAELVRIADRLREGSEIPFARTLAALCHYAANDEAGADLEAALLVLRNADAKQRLASVLNCAAAIDLDRGKCSLARKRAEEALLLSCALERRSDAAVARVVLARAAAAENDAATLQRQLSELRDGAVRGVSAQAWAAVESLRADLGGEKTTARVARSRRRQRGPQNGSGGFGTIA
ncbi:MAG TPA: hypothetical protein VMT89_03490, partial [Candidatus Acidoferrales bacterium]|nr:hypothetical protein [Candidatus Acidoferrales bacterium]